jgi:hypothetical protein
MKYTFSMNNNQLSKIFHVLRVVAFYTGIYLIFFSPVLFSGRLLAPGDGIFCYLPNFVKRNMLWDPMLFSGYPVSFDPQAMILYPLSLIFSFIGSWNGFVLSAYILASSFTYGYVYTITQSRLAGLISGLIYGMSGFMMAHLGHITIIHAAAWLPLMLWAAEKQRLHFTPFWFAIACISVTLTVLSGHPQILAYALGLGTLYTGYFGWSLGKRRWKYYGQYLITIVIGLAMASILLIPAAEFINQTSRSQMSFDQFVSYSLPPQQIVQLVFPFLFGGFKESFYGASYFGQWNLAEITGYAGIFSLLLTAIAIFTHWKRPFFWFWTGIGLFSFLLALGNLTPLAEVIYYVPIFNKFQAIARHFLLATLSISILSGLAILAIQKQMISKKQILSILLLGLAIMLGGCAAITLLSSQLKAYAFLKGIEKIDFFPWSNPAVGIPLILFLLGCIVLFFWDRKTQSGIRQFLLLSVLIVDLGSFGWFLDWRYGAPQKDITTPPESAQRYRALLQNTHQRIAPIRGVMGSTDELPPNLSKLWEVPSASGYGSLILTRLIELLSMSVPDGGIKGVWASSNNQSFDIMSIRYVFLQKKDAISSPIKTPTGIAWGKEDLTFTLGTGCGLSNPSSININLPEPVKTNAIGLVSAMSCSTAIPDNTEVLRIVATDLNENLHSVSVLAGRDTSEWAFDFPEIHPSMKHKKAKVFLSFPVVRDKKQGQGHRYVAVLPFAKELEIKRLEFQWVGPQAVISIQKISLFDEKEGTSYPLSMVMGDLTEKGRWRHVEDIGEVRVYENLRVMPRAWVVPEVVNLKKEEVLKIIQTSQLSDGRLFDPYKIALVEEPFNFKAIEWDEKATAKLVRLSNNRIEIQTNSRSLSFLVLSDVYYPGWKAFVNGVETNLFRTNYTLRGILLPEGSHIVHFVFKPKSFYYGAGISAGSFFLLLLLVIGFQSKCRRIKKEEGALSAKSSP